MAVVKANYVKRGRGDMGRAKNTIRYITSNSRKQLNILISHSFLSELFVKKMSIKTVP
jgi:hypothetical protein